MLGVAVPMASAVADVHAARRDYLDESGGRYVHVIADGGVGRVRRHRPRRSPAARTRSWSARRWPGPPRRPGRGFHWGSEAHHAELPRGERVRVGTIGSLEEILCGPSRVSDGSMNLVGALRRAMATTGYSDLKEFQRVEVTVAR